MYFYLNPHIIPQMFFNEGLATKIFQIFDSEILGLIEFTTSAVLVHNNSRLLIIFLTRVPRVIIIPSTPSFASVTKLVSAVDQLTVHLTFLRFSILGLALGSHFWFSFEHNDGTVWFDMVGKIATFVEMTLPKKIEAHTVNKIVPVMFHYSISFIDSQLNFSHTGNLFLRVLTRWKLAVICRILLSINFG